MPTSTPVATGSIAMASVFSEPPKASSISPTIATPPATASRSTSDLICVRDATANVPAPETTSCNPSAADVPASKRPRSVCSACCCASRSAPSARVVAISTARVASRETHTPPALRGAVTGSIASAMRAVSPVGSRSSTGFNIAPAGVPSSAVVSSIAVRRPSAVKRAASTAGLSK